MELFWRHGYETTSMAMLLKALDLTAPSLYAAFGNKEQLFLEAVEHYVRVYGGKVFAPLAETLPAREAIARLLQNAAHSVSQPDSPAGCMVALATLNTSDPTLPAPALLRKIRRDQEVLIRERLSQAIKDGELPVSTDTARLARYFHALLGGLRLLAVDGATRNELKAVAEDAMAAWPTSI